MSPDVQQTFSQVSMSWDVGGQLGIGASPAKYVKSAFGVKNEKTYDVTKETDPYYKSNICGTITNFSCYLRVVLC